MKTRMLLFVSISILFFSGKQKQSAMIAFIGFYLFGIPIAVLLMFFIRIDIYGFWIGIIVAETITNLLLFTCIQRFNWERHTKEALIRISFNPKDAATNMSVISTNNEVPSTITTNTRIDVNENTWTKTIGIKVFTLLLFVAFLVIGIITSTKIPL